MKLFTLMAMAAFAPEGLGSGTDRDDDELNQIMAAFGIDPNDDVLDPDEEFNPDDYNDNLSILLGLDGLGDGETPEATAKITCSKGDISADLFDTDAWKQCVAESGKTPLEWVAIAGFQALKAGNDEAFAKIATTVTDEADAMETAEGKTQDEKQADFDRGADSVLSS